MTQVTNMAQRIVDLEREVQEWRDDAELKNAARAQKAEAVVEAARELKLDAGVDDIDSRLNYVMIQTDRRTWQEFDAALTAYDEEQA